MGLQKTGFKRGLLIQAGILLLAVLTRTGLGQEWVDRDRFPEAYSILTSDHVMYPDNVTDWPMKIDAKRQLFVDDYVISSMENIIRQIHQPAKHPDNPLKYSGWYQNPIWGMPVAVQYDETTGLFRMWHNLHYAESYNGVSWTYVNRIISEGGVISGFMYNPDIPAEQGPYKIILDTHKQSGVVPGFFVYRSQDGKNWQRQTEEPILQQTMNHMMSYTPESKAAADNRVFQYENPDHFQSIGLGDTSVFQYDPVLKKYTCSGKYTLYMPTEKFGELGILSDGKPRLRLQTFSESDDLIHWSSPRYLFFPDQYDTPGHQIYGHFGFPYESMWIGIIREMQLHAGGFKQVDLKLSYSRDGRHWLRPRDRTPFIPVGEPDSWEADYLGHAFYPPTPVGDELWFYYHGARNGDRDNSNWSFYIGLAKLRRDGFVSLNAGADAGTVITRPMTFTGTKLYVNADVQAGGWIKAAVLTRDMDAVESYGLAEAVAMTTNTTKGRMEWQSAAELIPPLEEHIRLVFQLKNTKLYSFWIE